MCTLLALLTALLMPVYAVAAEDVPALSGYDGENSDLYCRTQLSKMKNAEALLYAYDSIYEAVDDGEGDATVSNSEYKITVDELQTVYNAYSNDHPEHFWLSGQWGISYDPATNIAYSLHADLLFEGDELEKARDEFDAAVEKMISGISYSMSEFDRERILHDRLCAAVTYNGSPMAHTAYGSLVQGVAVCDGYAEAFQYLLRLVGIQSLICTGTSINPSTGSPEGHAWNIVRIDGKYYHTDVTWDDQEIITFYAYFNKSEDEITADHAMERQAYAIPECTSDDADYFAVNPCRLSSFNTKKVTAQMNNNSHMARFYVTGDKTAFTKALGENIRTVASGIGIKGGFSYGVVSVGREVVAYIRSTGEALGQTVFGIFSGSGNAAETAEIALVSQKTSAVAYKTTVKNIDTVYSVDGVAKGNYTLRVTVGGETVHEDSVTVGEKAVESDIALYTVGDINNDGKINSIDSSALENFVTGTASASARESKAADINNDGKINSVDASLLKAIVLGNSNS